MAASDSHTIKCYLKEVDNLALANAQMNLDKAFNNFFRKIKNGEKEKVFQNSKVKKIR